MIRLFIITTLFFSTSLLWAQSPSMIYYKGLGRSLADLDRMDEKSNYLKNDSTSERRDLNGIFLFDLGVNVEPNEQLRAKVIMRLSNPFGAFYSFGSLFRFRQVSLEGILAKKFYYKIGDMDLQMTPYTLHNSEDSWYEFESRIFADRRAIMQYENFNFGNKWRMQGVYAKTGWVFPKWADSLNISAFTTRTNRANLLTTPDRLISGAELSLGGKKYIDAGARVIQHYDVIGTAPDSNKNYKNAVVSFNGAFKLDNEKYSLRLAAEGGFSTYEKENKVKKDNYSVNDNFFELGLHGKGKKSGLFASASFRQVGALFYSAAAQTRRVYDYAAVGIFDKGGNQTLNRSQTLFDRVQSTAVYNYDIKDHLMNYSLYNFVNPYGKATPNRTGVNVDLGIKRPDSLIDAKVFVASLGEITGEGVDEKRKFTEIGAGLNFSLNKALGIKRNILLNAGYKSSSAKRSGIAAVDLKTNYLDLGAQLEFAKQISLLLGYKQFTANGKDYTSVYDNFNRILSYTYLENNFTVSTVAIGAKYDLSSISYVTLNYAMNTMKDKKVSMMDYKYNQLFVNFTINF